ncbi:MAG: hypothetical protein J6R47_06345 [Acholeplasmatales bacterium]|nr:hypothetical protein [Acholeplasmatales bacterium]
MSNKINKSITVDQDNWIYIQQLARVNRRSVSGMIDWLISRSREEDNNLEQEAKEYDKN